MKKILSFLLALSLFISISVPIVNANEATVLASPSAINQSVSGELVVSIEDSVVNGYSIQSINSQTSKHSTAISHADFTIKDSLLSSITASSGDIQSFSENDGFKEQVAKDMGHVYLVHYPAKYKSANLAIKALKKELKKAGLKVRYIEPNFKLYAIGEVEEAVNASDIGALQVHNSQLWHYNMIKAPQAWNTTSGNSNVKVAVLDTGIDFNHPALSRFLDRNLSKNFTTTSPTDIMDRQGHGTHVAGTIVSEGSVSGVMQNATLVSIKVLGDNGTGSMYGIQQGVLHAANMNADVINMSLGGGDYSQGFADACNTAVSRGVIIVAATGNDGAGAISYPAAYSSVIAVGAVDSNRTRASFSNYGTGLEVMAPGVNIYSSVPNNSYTTMSGTSMASPHVAGVAGLIRSANKNITVTEARNILKNTAQNAGASNQYGYGIVDADAAVRAAGGTPIQTVATPSFNPNGGTYATTQNVAISTATADATIRYTTNGTEPTSSSTVYSNAISISSTTTLKAKAFKAGMNDSATATAVYTIGSSTTNPWTAYTSYAVGDIVSYGGQNYICRIAHTAYPGWEPANVPALWLLYSGGNPIQTVATPSFNPNGGTYATAQTVGISTVSADATIRYTTNGTEPTSSSTVYSNAISISFSTTLKAKAFKVGMNDSATATATYTIDSGTTTVATPSFNPNGGTYATAQNVAISTLTADATIRYTTNGTEPTSSSPVYNNAINISSTTTLKAKAFKAGMNDSVTATAVYTINTGSNVWTAYKLYTTGDIVSYNGKNYSCRQTHTAYQGWEPTNTPALWLEV